MKRQVAGGEGRPARLGVIAAADRGDRARLVAGAVAGLDAAAADGAAGGARPDAGLTVTPEDESPCQSAGKVSDASSEPEPAAAQLPSGGTPALGRRSRQGTFTGPSACRLALPARHGRNLLIMFENGNGY